MGCGLRHAARHLEARGEKPPTTVLAAWADPRIDEAANREIAGEKRPEIRHVEIPRGAHAEGRDEAHDLDHRVGIAVLTFGRDDADRAQSIVDVASAGRAIEGEVKRDVRIGAGRRERCRHVDGPLVVGAGKIERLRRERRHRRVGACDRSPAPVEVDVELTDVDVAVRAGDVPHAPPTSSEMKQIGSVARRKRIFTAAQGGKVAAHGATPAPTIEKPTSGT